jgi:glutathione peroxidase
MTIRPEEIPLVQHLDISLYDFVLEDLDSGANVLESNKGKVTMVVNVTGECANSAQYIPIQSLYNEYKDQGFEVVAVPSTDFCDHAYGEFKDSNASPQNMRDHMKKLYKTDLHFSKLTATVNDSKTGLEIHPLYEAVQSIGGPMQGNFEKIIISKDGKKIVRFCNSDLLNLGYDAGNRSIDADTALTLVKEAIETLLNEEE